MPRKRSSRDNAQLDDADLQEAQLEVVDGFLAHVAGFRSTPRGVMLLVRHGLPHWWRPHQAALFVMGHYGRQCPGLPSRHAGHKRHKKGFVTFPTVSLDKLPEDAGPWRRLSRLRHALTEALAEDSARDLSELGADDGWPDEVTDAVAPFMGERRGDRDEAWVRLYGERGVPVPEPLLFAAHALVLHEPPGARSADPDTGLAFCDVRVCGNVSPLVPLVHSPRPHAETVRRWVGSLEFPHYQLTGLKMCSSLVTVGDVTQSITSHCMDRAAGRRYVTTDVFTEAVDDTLTLWAAVSARVLLRLAGSTVTDAASAPPVVALGDNRARPILVLDKLKTNSLRASLGVLRRAYQQVDWVLESRSPCASQLGTVWAFVCATLSHALPDPLAEAVCRGMPLRHALSFFDVSVRPMPPPLPRETLGPKAWVTMVAHGRGLQLRDVCLPEDARATLCRDAVSLLASSTNTAQAVSTLRHQALFYRVAAELPRPTLLFPAALAAARALCYAYGLLVTDEASAQWPTVVLAPPEIPVPAPEHPPETPLVLGHEALLAPHRLCAQALGLNRPMVNVEFIEDDDFHLSDRFIHVVTGPCWGATDIDTLRAQARSLMRQMRTLQRKGARSIRLVLGGLECAAGFVELLSSLNDVEYRARHACKSPVTVATGMWLGECEVVVSNSFHASDLETLERRAHDDFRPVLVVNAYAVMPRVLRRLMDNAHVHAPLRPVFLLMGARPPATLRWRGLTHDLAALIEECDRQYEEDGVPNAVCNDDPRVVCLDNSPDHVSRPLLSHDPAAHRNTRIARRPLSLATAGLDFSARPESLIMPCLLANSADLLYLPRLCHDTCDRWLSLVPDPDMTDDEWRWIHESVVVSRNGRLTHFCEPQTQVPVACVPEAHVRAVPAQPVARMRGSNLPLVCPWQPLFA